jgi:hypothetical protein
MNHKKLLLKISILMDILRMLQRDFNKNCHIFVVYRKEKILTSKLPAFHGNTLFARCHGLTCLVIVIIMLVKIFNKPFQSFWFNFHDKNSLALCFFLFDTDFVFKSRANTIVLPMSDITTSKTFGTMSLDSDSKGVV